ncbi:MAG: GDP-mannose 4,6-dehydratase, partial [Oscillospiraceae bacterium]
MDMNFYRGKRVLVTGHTGFKGSWLCQILVNAGATVTGYSLPAPTEPSLFNLSKVEDKITHVIGDVRDFNALKAVF